jgi:maleylpyruvate isomerase
MILYGFYRSSATWRVRIALLLKNLDYDLRPVNLVREGGGDQFRPEHAARNPMRQVPVLEVEEDGKKAHLAQSMAILEYLEERYPDPPLFPASRLLRARARQIAETVNSGIQPLQNTAVRVHVASLSIDADAWIRHWVTKGLVALEALVSETSGRYSVGDTVTVADVFVVPELEFTKRFAIDLAPYPTLMRIGRACGELDAFQKAHASKQPDAPAE